MFEFFSGVAIGAAFSPFWIKLWNYALTFAPIRNFIKRTPTDADTK